MNGFEQTLSYVSVDFPRADVSLIRTTNLLVVGMGHVGSLIALLLGELGMQVAGVDMDTTPSIPAHVDCTSADITDPHILARLCQGKDAVIRDDPCTHVTGAFPSSACS